MGACSRNWQMQLDDDNVYAQLWNDLDLDEKLLGCNIAIQGEIIGPRIQGNRYKRAKQEFYVFDIYDIDQQRYLNPEERQALTFELGLTHVPVLSLVSKAWNGRELEDVHCSLTLDDVLNLADGKSELFDTAREGLVFKHLTEPITFKAISNKFLLRNE